MKVALCLSGQPRCLDECFESLDRFILQPYQPDIFFHFWNSSYLPFDERITKVLYGVEAIPQWKRFDGEYALKCMNLLKPKRFIVEPQKMMDCEEFIRSCNPANSRMQAKSFLHVLSMFHSIYMANACKWEWEKLNGIQYDVVIRCRTDLRFLRTPELTVLDKISIPDNDSFGGFNDQFSFGNSHNMDVYASCIDHITRLFRRGTNFHPETILRDHLKDQQVPVQLILICAQIVR